MTKIYTRPVHFLRLLLSTSVCICCFFVPRTSYGQTYYSKFGNASGKFSVTEPSGGTCNAPGIENINAFVDNSVDSYASFKGNISSPLTCTNGNYAFTTYLNLPKDSAYISGKMQSGFRIKIPSHISITRLTKNISIQTYLDSTLQESYNGDSIYAVDLGIDSSRFIVYANTSKKFNRLQLTVKSDIIPLNKDFEFGVIYAMATNFYLLPVTITNYKATTTGNNVTISWQSLNEVNISGYRIEKSTDNGASYSALTIIPAKGGSAAINYSFIDKALNNGNFLYRIVSLDKDGLFKATEAKLVTIAGKISMVLMPSLVKAGQAVIVNSGIIGNFQLAVFDLQGRMIKQMQVNNGDRVSINTGSLSTGTYIVKVMTASGKAVQAKFIVN